MRLAIHDLARPKAAAKGLAAISSDVALSAAQAALARAIGYRDWHELQGFACQSEGLAEPFDLVRAVPVIGGVADELSLDRGDVQFALTRSRLFGPLSLQDHLPVRAAHSRT